MIITRYQMGMIEGQQYDNAEWVRYEDHLSVVEELEYDIRYEREQKEESEDLVQDLLEQIIELRTSLKVALDEVDRQAVEINEYVEAQPPI